MLGLSLLIILKDFGTLSLWLTAIIAVGVSERDKKFSIGYQYQCYRNRTRPITEFCRKFPSCVVKLIVELRPAALRIPLEIMPPMRERISSYLLFANLSKSFLIVVTFGS